MSSETRSRKYSISAGMSSRRSASEGERIGTTDSRWNKSSRNCPSVIACARSRLVEEMMRTSTCTGVGPADALETLVDQHAQDFGLRLRRHVGDLVEIERAAVRLLERADAARPVRPGLDPEQLRLHPLGRNGRRVDDDERARRARRMRVDHPRGELLAGARRPRDQHARIGGTDFLDQPLADWRRRARRRRA